MLNLVYSREYDGIDMLLSEICSSIKLVIKSWSLVLCQVSRWYVTHFSWSVLNMKYICAMNITK